MAWLQHRDYNIETERLTRLPPNEHCVNSAAIIQSIPTPVVSSCGGSATSLAIGLCTSERTVPEEKLLDLLYQAPGNERRWQDFLLQLSSFVESDTAEIALFDCSNQQFNLNHSVGVPPNAAKAYNERFGAIDEWYLRARGKVSRGYVGPGELLCTAEELAKSEFYNEFLRPNNWLHSAAAVIEHGGSVMAVLTLLRTPKGGVFGKTEMQKIQALLPHVQRSLFLHRRMVDLQARNELEHWGLDQASFALILLRLDGKLVSANKPANELCAAGVLSLTSGVARLCDPKDDRLFQSLIRSASQPTLSRVAGGVMKIHRSFGALLVLCVVPIRHSTISTGGAVAVFVTDPARRLSSAGEVLQKAYELTPAEVKLPLLMGDGISASEAAGRLNVSRETVKTQLASIFRKTGARRQAQLVRLLSSLSSPNIS